MKKKVTGKEFKRLKIQMARRKITGVPYRIGSSLKGLAKSGLAGSIERPEYVKQRKS